MSNYLMNAGFPVGASKFCLVGMHKIILSDLQGTCTKVEHVIFVLCMTKKAAENLGNFKLKLLPYF